MKSREIGIHEKKLGRSEHIEDGLFVAHKFMDFSDTSDKHFSHLISFNSH
jgi:hypothetical protein